MVQPYWASRSGSSPRARGAHARRDPGVRDLGIIPASAGSTPVFSPTTQGSRDHPRERGEHLLVAALLMPLAGSSPRARGALRSAMSWASYIRIIPASAGSTRSLSPPRQPRKDHPRERGEHSPPTGPRSRETGSSPRARGAHLRPQLLRGGDRIIPASAGSTGSRPRQERPWWDHPRERGEHTRPPPPLRVRNGSSPRARGARGVGNVDERPERIIPASAGSTAPYALPYISVTDHPRERGEHCRKSVRTGVEVGSSPRARGAPMDEGVAVGNVGSSPRARGAQRRRMVPWRWWGIIPASAGSTGF